MLYSSSCRIGILATAVAAIILLLILGSVFLLKEQGAVCAVGNFPCGDTSECLDQKYFCDKIRHCSNGVDEDHDTCMDNDYMWKHMRDNLHTANSTIADGCTLQDTLTRCTCTEGTTLDCRYYMFTRMPDILPQNTSRLLLQFNAIKSIHIESSGARLKLKSMYMGYNNVTKITKGSFDDAPELRTLSVEVNQLAVIEPGAFRGLNKLTYLFLQENLIKQIPDGVLNELDSLSWLNLESNKLELIHGLPRKLDYLSLTDNRFTALSSDYIQVANNSELAVLDLCNNLIEYIDPSFFERVKYLGQLTLRQNKIKYLTANVFASPVMLQTLDLSVNPMQILPDGIFENLKNLTSLELLDVDIENMNENLFKAMDMLKFIYFKRFEYCHYASHVKVCKPNGDGISSLENLLAMNVARIGIWLVAVTTCIGNVLVLVYRWFFKGENLCYSIFIINLSFADLLIGVYLIIVASHDIAYRGKYNTFAIEWMRSGACQLCGVLAMTSCEVSVFIITYISLEKYIVITSINEPRPAPTARKTAITLCCIWFVGLVLGVLPIVLKDLFGNFYGTNGMCFPLHIHEPYLHGWQYSLLVFVGINLPAMLIIAFCYTALLCNVRTTQQMANSVHVGESMIVKRFFFIVATDVACWIPVIIVKMLAFSNISISDQLYIILTVFVVPINSALNPILYSLSTITFKTKWVEVIHTLGYEGRLSVGSSSNSSGSTTATSNSQRVPDASDGRYRISFSSGITGPQAAHTTNSSMLKLPVSLLDRKMTDGPVANV